MPTTTAYEREIRRREVIKLRTKGYTQQEIAEELGVSRGTIANDLERVNSELSKLDDPDVLKREMKQAAQLLLQEEYEDLDRADREQDERAKHRAKTSFRQTIELLRDIEEETVSGTSDADTEWLDDVDPELKERVMDAAGDKVETMLVE